MITANRFLIGAMILGGATLSQAQTLNYWVNKTGDASALTPSTIYVMPNSTVSLAVYAQTSGMGNLIGLDTLFGYDQTSTVGASATPAGSGLSFNSLTWNSPFSTGDLSVQQGGGFGASGTRPYGTYASSTLLTGNFGSLDGAGAKVFDIVLNIGALANGDSRTVTVFSAMNGANPADNWSSSALNESFIAAGSSNYTVNIEVVPEPATLAVLGLGLATLARRKRNSA